MKTKFKLITKLTIVMMVLTFLSSCTEEESISNEAVEDANSEEVAEIVAGALAEDAQGMAAQFKASAFEAEEVEFDGDTAARVEQNVCGQEFSDNFELESPENQAIFRSARANDEPLPPLR